MQKYILRRVLQAVIALFVVSMLIFYLARISGDPTTFLLPMEAPPELYERVRHEWGLDKPLHVQYGIFITRALQGDLGESTRQRRPVVEAIADRLPNSMKLAGVAMLMALLIGIPLAVKAAVRKDTIVDRSVKVVAGLGQAVPTFWVGLVLMWILAVRLRLLPTSGMGDWRSYLMPGFTLAWFMLAAVTRLVRSSMLDVLDNEYIKMARVKGLSERAVVWKHALKNSLLPLAGFGGVYTAILVTSSITVEVVFEWPGFGLLAYDALMSRDFPLMQGVVLAAGAFAIVANLITDILYAYLDPRIRY